MGGSTPICYNRVNSKLLLTRPRNGCFPGRFRPGLSAGLGPVLGLPFFGPEGASGGS